MSKKLAEAKAKEFGLPKKVNILGSEYKISYVDNLIDADMGGRHPVFGQIDWVTSTIRIYVGDRTPAAIKKVIYHEILHGVIMEYQIMEYLDLPEEMHERVVDNLATGLYDTFTRNGMITW